jgi:hypothetical protein
LIKAGGSKFDDDDDLNRPCYLTPARVIHTPVESIHTKPQEGWMLSNNDDLNRQKHISTILQDAQGGISNSNILSTIAGHCGKADRNGKGYRGICPICKRNSLTVWPGQQVAVLVKCWHCESCGLNDGYTEQREYFVGVGLLEPNDRELLRFDKEKYEKLNAERRAEAERIWDSKLGIIQPITNDENCCAGRYPQARGLTAFIGHPALRCTSSQLMARVWHVHYGVSAVQWTWLNEDGSDRDRERKPGRVTFGVLKGGAVWVGAPVPNEWCVVAEGLETCLSAMIILGIKCGAAVLGPNLKGLVLPRGVRRLHIAADNDDTGRGASACAARKWRGQGIQVSVSMPDVEGADFNDVLMASRGATQ